MPATEILETGIKVVDLIFHQCNNGVFCIEVKFGGICIFPSEDVACVLDYGDLHTEADTEKRDMGCGGLPDDIDEPVLVKAVHRVAKGADTWENDMVCG